MICLDLSPKKITLVAVSEMDCWKAKKSKSKGSDEECVVVVHRKRY